MLALRFSVDRKRFENGTFRKRWRHHNHVTFLTEVSSQIQNGRRLLPFEISMA